MTDLTQKTCKPCEGGVQPLKPEKVEKLLEQIPGWTRNSAGWLVKEYQFNNFQETMDFVKQIAKLAEQEGHHPNIYIHSWNQLRLELYTHAINGLSENDFIMAAKINQKAP